MKIEEVAQLCHELNRAYCLMLGDNSQPEWKDAPEWQRASALNGVKMHLSNPQASPSASHEAWLEEKRKTGWKFGAIKDPGKKEHPCFVPYEDLPEHQQVKDYLFRGVVHAVAGFVE